LQASNELQRQPRPAKLKAVFDTYRRRVDFHPAGLCFFGVGFFDIIVEKRLLLFGRRPQRWFFRCLPHTKTSRFVEFPEPSYHALSRTALGAIRFDERPIGVSLAVFLLKILANEHVQRLPTSHNPPSPKVLTTSRSTPDPTANSETTTETKRLTSNPSPKYFWKNRFPHQLGKSG